MFIFYEILPVPVMGLVYFCDSKNHLGMLRDAKTCILVLKIPKLLAFDLTLLFTSHDTFFSSFLFQQWIFNGWLSDADGYLQCMPQNIDRLISIDWFNYDEFCYHFGSFLKLECLYGISDCTYVGFWKLCKCEFTPFCILCIC